MRVEKGNIENFLNLKIKVNSFHEQMFLSFAELLNYLEENI